MKSGNYKVLVSMTEYGRNIIFLEDASFFNLLTDEIKTRHTVGFTFIFHVFFYSKTPLES